MTRFDGNIWTTYNHNNSLLPSDCFWDVQVDADNRLWIATAGDLSVVGLACFDGADWTIYNTAVPPVTVPKSSNMYYDLRGRRINYPTHGIYILNGYKIVK